MIDSDSKVPAELDTLPDVRLKKFSPAELIKCSECRRANPPTRATCLYCGAALPRAGVESAANHTSAAALVKDDIDAGEAYYLVADFVAAQANAAIRLAEIASLVRLESREIECLAAQGGAFPIARMASLDEAGTMAGSLRPLGINVELLKEEMLNLALPIRKARVLEISPAELVAYSTSGEESTVSWADLILMVQGRLVTSRTEVEEKRRRGTAKPVGARQLFTDQPVLDIYFAGDDPGWRISATNFDFSCLGTDKGATVFENLKKLIDIFKLRAPNVEVDDSFQNLRGMLSKLWPPASPDTTHQRRRTITGKVDATITLATNLAQFNNYSRTRQRLKVLEPESGP